MTSRSVRRSAAGDTACSRGPRREDESSKERRSTHEANTHPAACAGALRHSDWRKRAFDSTHTHDRCTTAHACMWAWATRDAPVLLVSCDFGSSPFAPGPQRRAWRLGRKPVGAPILLSRERKKNHAVDSSFVCMSGPGSGGWGQRTGDSKRTDDHRTTAVGGLRRSAFAPLLVGSRCSPGEPSRPVQLGTVRGRSVLMDVPLKKGRTMRQNLSIHVTTFPPLTTCKLAWRGLAALGMLLCLMALLVLATPAHAAKASTRLTSARRAMDMTALPVSILPTTNQACIRVVLGDAQYSPQHILFTVSLLNNCTSPITNIGWSFSSTTLCGGSEWDPPYSPSASGGLGTTQLPAGGLIQVYNAVQFNDCNVNGVETQYTLFMSGSAHGLNATHTSDSVSGSTLIGPSSRI